MDLVAFEALIAVGIDGAAAVLLLESGAGAAESRVMRDFQRLGTEGWVKKLCHESTQVKEEVSRPGFYKVVGQATPDDDSLNYVYLRIVKQDRNEVGRQIKGHRIYQADDQAQFGEEFGIWVDERLTTAIE
ncbi:hypothetical protein [Ferrimonas sp.]|uniref:hypothetical protein n=1 Tax=Ferrimonas sp. TaxID=2080861 RepID=UPI003A9294E3